MSNQQQSPNTAKKLTSSFSSPDSFLQSDISHHEQNIPTDVSIASSIDATTATNAVTTSMTTSSLSAAGNTTTGTIKFNETRDSGFSDSIIEDSFIKSNKTLRTEHGIEVKNSDISLSTNVYANKGTLKSVEEDINIIQPNQQNVSSNKLEELQSNLDENGKDYITIVKTTKVTTKVKHVNNKKNKKKNKKAAASASTQEATANDTDLQAATEPADVTVKTTTTIASQVSTATLLITSDNGTIENLIVEESNNVAEECSDSSSNTKDKIEICQNKSTEELVYETEVKENITLSETIQQPNQVVDLNSTVLDSEDILSTYSNNNANTNLVPQPSPRHVEKTDNVLNDVTQSVLNQDQEIKQETTETVVTQPSTEKSKSKEEPQKKNKKSRFNLFFKSKSKKNKKEDSNLATPESPSKKQKIEITVNEKIDTTAIENMPSPSSGATKYVLLDQDQKDRILYLKPQCADLLLNEFLKYEKNEKSKTNTKTQLSYLKENDYKLKIILDKMILRSLDLLGHDRIESFEKLTVQLKEEYNVVNLENNNAKSLNNIKKVYLSNIDNKTCELVFNNLLKKSLLEDKILLKLKLDKTNLKPFVELIEFDQSKLENVKIIDNTTNNINETLLEQIRLDNIDKIESEKHHHDVEFIIEEEKVTEKLVVVAEEKLPQPKVPQVQQSSSQSNSNCGTTPPPTPQNELTNNLTDKNTRNLDKSNEDENTKVNLDKVNELLENQNNEDGEIKTVKDINDGARIVLNTVKEPPIRFPSDDDNFQKPLVAIQNVQETVSDPNLVVKSTDQKSESKKTKSKNKKSAFSCLSCAGNKLENEQEALPPVEKKKKEKKDKKSKKTSTETKEVVTETQKPTTEPVISQVKVIDQELFSNLDSKPKDQELESKDEKECEAEEVKHEPEETKEVISTQEVTLENSEKQEEVKVEETAQLDLDREIQVETPVINTEVEVKQNDQEEKKEEIKDTKKGKKDKKKNKNKKKSDSEDKQDQDLVENIQNQETKPVDEPVIEQPPKVEEKEIVQDKKNKKKQKNKKEKAKAQSSEEEIKTDANDVEIKIEKDDKNDEVKIEISNEPNIDENLKLDVNLTQVDTIQVETKSIKNLETNEIIEISQTIVNKTESTTIIDNLIDNRINELDTNTSANQQPSELNIDTEIKIEKEDVNKPEEVQLEILNEKETSDIKPVKLKESKKKNKKEKSKPKNDDEPVVSCFSCKSRKAKKAKKDNLEQKEEDEIKKEVKSESVEPIKTNQKEIDNNLFVGLDPLPSDKTTEVKILNEDKNEEILESKPEEDVKDDSKDLPIIEKTEDIKQENLNENSENIIEPNLVETNETNEKNLNETENDASELQTQEDPKLEEKSDKLEISEVNIVDNTQKVEIISTNKQNEESNIAINEPKKLSDDIVVLPDPNERIEVKVTTEQEQKIQSDDAKVKLSQDKKSKKSSSFSCFSTKKAKNKENIDKSKAPQPKKEKKKKKKDDTKIENEQIQVPQVTLTLETPQTTEIADQAISAQKPSENWAVGLDRNENDPILNKDPVIEDTSIKNIPEKAEEKDDAKEEIEPLIQNESETNDNKAEESKEIIEAQPEPSSIAIVEDFGIKTEATENINSKSASDLLSGAYIKIDREPDHAVVPIVTQDRSNIKIDQDKEKTEIETKTEQLKDKKTKSKNKTSLIDLPLINILQPSKNKKVKKSKNKSSEENKKNDEPTPATDNQKINLNTPTIDLNDIKLDKPYEELNEEVVKDKKDLIETQTEEILTTTIIVESTYKETNLIEETVAKNQDDTQIQEQEQEQEQHQQQAVNDEPIEEKTEKETQPVLEIKEKEIPEYQSDVNTNEDLKTTEEPLDLKNEDNQENKDAGAHIVIDRLPDIVVLPEIDLSSRTNYQITEEKANTAEPEQIKNDNKKAKKSKGKKDKKQKTSIIDLPLINILRPKQAKETKKEIIEKVEVENIKIEDVKNVKSEEVENLKTESENVIIEVKEPEENNETEVLTVKDELPIVELKEEEKDDDTKIDENIQEPAAEIVLEQVENIKEPLKEDQNKETEITVKEHVKDKSKSKKPNPIDLPLINILKPKEKKSSNKKSSVSCFSCRSRKLKEKESHQKPEALVESVTGEKVAVTDNLSHQIIDINVGEVKLDAPYKTEVEDQNPLLDADVLKQKLEILETEINKTTEVRVEENNVIEYVKESKVEETNQVMEESSKTIEESSKTIEESSKTIEESSKTIEESSKTFEESSKTIEESSKTFEEESLKTEIKEEKEEITLKINETVESAGQTLINKTENVESSTSVEIIKIEQSTTLKSDDFTQTVKQETTIVIEDRPIEPEIKIEPVTIQKNIEIIEFTKPGEVNVSVKKEDIPPEALPVIAETKKSKKKEKLKSKKVKDEDDVVSCFSCKSRKAKAKKDDLNKEQTVEPNKDSNSKDSPTAVDDSGKSQLRPEIKVDSNLFKGLDRVPSVGDAEHIVNHQTFLDNKPTLESVEKEIPAHQEQSEESEKSEPSEVKEILINQDEENKNQSVDPVQEKTEPENVEENLIKSNNIETENIVPEESEKDAEVSKKPDIIVLSNTPDIVVLPDPNQRETNPTSQNNLEPLPVVNEGVTEKTDKKKKEKKVKTKNKSEASCFACKSKKSKKSVTEKKEPTEKELEVKAVDTNKDQIEQPINITVTPADEIELQIQPSGQPPKKPPRGHLDESFINNEIISTVNIESSEYTEKETETKEKIETKESETKIVEIKENILEEVLHRTEEKLEEYQSTTNQEKLVEEVVIEVKNEIPLEQNEVLPEVNKEEIEAIQEVKESTPEVPIELPAPIEVKDSKDKEKKTKKGLTSIIDLPLIEILAPKDTKKDKKDKKDKKSKSKKKSDTAIDVKIIDTQTENKQDLPENKDTITENQTKTAQQISHEDYFKGLDPIRIRSSQVDEHVTENNKDLSETHDKVEISCVEIQIEKAEEVKPVLEQVETKTEESKFEDKNKPVEKVLSIEIPTVLDIQKSDYTYVSPGKVENWSTDPLPSVQIGLHKVDFSKSTERVEQSKKADEAQNLTILSETPKIDQVEETKKSDKSDKKAKKDKKDKKDKSKKEDKVQPKETQLAEQQQEAQVPSSYIAEIIDSSVKKIAAETEKQKTDENEEIIREFTRDEKKLIKSNKKLIVEYLKSKINCTKKQLIESQQIADPKLKKLTKESLIKDKLSTKLFEKSLKTLSKKDTKNLTYTELNKKLEKEIKKKDSTTDEIQNSVVNQLKIEINSGDLLKVNKKDKTLKSSEQSDLAKNNQTTLNSQNIDKMLDSKSSSLDKLNDQPGVMKRFPSLTWREANERARILFYKGRVPSIRYNEKRDSFRVSMIQQINTADGKEKTTEVPVYDDDVRRLLNSCGLYWDGESISLLNKSDEIFLKAQQEAFQILKSMSSNFNQNEFLSFSDSGLTSLSNNKIYSTVTTTTTTTTTSSTTSKTETFKSTSNTESTIQNSTLIQENSTN